jgi:hypothetical protein
MVQNTSTANPILNLIIACLLFSIVGLSGADDYSVAGRHGKELDDPRSLRREIVKDLAGGHASSA